MTADTRQLLDVNQRLEYICGLAQLAGVGACVVSTEDLAKLLQEGYLIRNRIMKCETALRKINKEVGRDMSLCKHGVMVT